MKTGRTGRWSVVGSFAAAVVWAASCGGGGSSAPTTPASPSAPPPATPAPPPATPVPVPTPSPEPAPTPVPTPDACPPLTRWYSTIHNITDPQGKVVSTPVVGGHVVIDSTPLYNGRSCNQEHNNCGGRQCEDPRGGDWKLLEGTSRTEVRENGYQFRIGPLNPGRHRWRVCPLADAEDAEGVPLEIGPNPCTEGEFFADNP